MDDRRPKTEGRRPNTDNRKPNTGHRKPNTGYLWGGRFEGALSEEAAALNRSLTVDGRLWREELEVDMAWAEALASAGAITVEESRIIVRGLERVGDHLAGEASLDGFPDEDIHTLIERLLTDEVGDTAGKLRTGRSRNDQVATITRLWAMRAVERVEGQVARLQAALLAQAEATVEVLAPAYTHLQRAQPIRLAHFFLSHLWPLVRDRERLSAARRSASVLPLGCGAVSGSGFPIDREALAGRLGFRRPAPNSLDAVSDRDFIVDLLHAAALLGVHLSRLGEDLVLFASSEFAVFRFDDRYSTGSSLMPHKRNPDIAELARGKSARLIGGLTAALTVLKGLPSGYNKDLQEDKSFLFDAFDTMGTLLPALAGAVETLYVDAEAAARGLEASMVTVDLADELVRRGVRFHDAHTAVGALVRLAESRGLSIFEVLREEARGLHEALPAALGALAGKDSDAVYERAVESRSVLGGTARESVERQIADARVAIRPST